MDASVRSMNRFHILINMQVDLNILHPSEATEKTWVILEYIPFHRHSIGQLEVKWFQRTQYEHVKLLV